ncbi:hypothetical protein K402DRAFT_325155 [Aulographum hederae CBS 113979]|uniref:Myb-like domain-containing protein n=1 Tax=Aulographum hederae CBS 113979 TaxID=1176131 RepID=A0A6G1HBQ3_9PEZI|nr:hypothetical protein K402DRAFT_325155 [Aulographum hederae CBS 113979]
MSHHHPSSYHGAAGPSSHLVDYHAAQHSRKRSRPHDDLQLDLQSLSGLTGDVAESAGTDHLPVELTPHGHHAQPQQGLYQAAASTSHHQHPGGPSQQQHHHHRLPNQQPPSKMRRMGYEVSSPVHQSHHGPPSVVGQEGMPAPAARPRGPKLKFTPEDDQLLVDLKEKKNLTWKQIADFFPGRSSGTLQVRYCTKLKAKTTHWTPEMVQKLRNSMQEYETDRWRIISTKVGSGFSAAACKEKAEELDAGIDSQAGAGGLEDVEEGFEAADLRGSSVEPGSAGGIGGGYHYEHGSH